jgi:HAD superfamily hydrolase (TIGR01509 family)
MPAFEGAIFDVDGVLVDSPHEEAWRESLRELMEGEWRDIRPQTTWSPDAFTYELYQAIVSGKPRESGAQAVLAHFGVPDVPARTVVYAARKQSMIEQLIDEGRFTAFPDGLRFAIDVKEVGLRLAAASSSKNARRLLQHIHLDELAVEQQISSPVVRPGRTLLDLFDVDVSGRTFPRGKPHPDMFLAAAAELTVAPERAVVLEDAPAGVQAGKAGGMAVVAIARVADDVDVLREAGADLVVPSLDHVDRAALRDARLVAVPAV